MAGLTLTSLGAAGTVTGSKHLLQRDGQALLIDCGLFQGIKNLREANWRPLPVDPSTIGAVAVTHAHLDHTGYLPRLVKEGFAGKIHSTSGTRDTAEIILRDSAHLQERDAEHLNVKRKTKHRPALPLYTTSDVDPTMKRFVTHRLEKAYEPLPGVTVVHREAGHILGASTITVTWDDTTVVFTGDLGRYDDPLMYDPEPIAEADVVVTEGTYGDRSRDDADPESALEEIVNRTVQRGGTVVIPAFAVGRTQMITYYLWRLIESGRIPRLPVHIDSPMAIKATDVFRNHPEAHKLTEAETDDMFSIAQYAIDPEQSKQISADRNPKVVLSASGMATGGRILHHLQAFAPDPRNSIVLAGYQSVGTRGRSLADGAKFLKLYGEWVPVNATVDDLHMFSAHADSGELIRWMGGFTRKPRKSFIVHAEPQSGEMLRQRMQHDLGWDHVRVAVQNQVYDL